MTASDQVREALIAFLSGLPETTVQTVVPGERTADGTPLPDVAWGDTFAFHSPDGAPGVMPFATIVTKNYPGDELSRLDRPGAFRVNVNVGRTAFAELIGYPPSDHADRAGEWDYAADGAVIPHPLYAKLGWVSVVNPAAAADVAELLRTAGIGTGPVRAEKS